jgi:protein TonB
MPLIVAKNKDVPDDNKPADVDDLKKATAGSTDQVGDAQGMEPGIHDNPGTGTGIVDAPPPPPVEIPTFVEQMPEYPGGYEAILAYLNKNLLYPELAKENNISGQVMVSFVVNEEGDVSDVKVSKGIGGGCDEEAARVVAQMGHWKPGKQNGRPTKVRYQLPIRFALE